MLGGKGSVNELINGERVCRTAPATPGLLNNFFSGIKVINSSIQDGYTIE